MLKRAPPSQLVGHPVRVHVLLLKQALQDLLLPRMRLDPPDLEVALVRRRLHNGLDADPQITVLPLVDLGVRVARTLAWSATHALSTETVVGAHARSMV